MDRRSPLPPAGTPRDDGSGVLARASGKRSFPGLLPESPKPARPYDAELVTIDFTRDPAQDADVHTNVPTYGGTGYGGTRYGGTRYGNYHFDWQGREWTLPPERNHEPGYQGTPQTRTGSVHGQVKWPTPPRAAHTLPIRAAGCPDTIPNDTVHVDKHGNVHGAVVFLDDIDSGRYGVMEPGLYQQAMQISGLLRQHECRFVPHVQVVSPVGAVLRLIDQNDWLDSGQNPHTWTGSQISDNQVLRFEMPRLVPRRVTLAKSGFWHIRDDQTAAGAWVVVAGHPYYTVTDELGQFHLDHIPPGTYTLVVWHEPVASRTRDGLITFGQPVVQKNRVTVQEGRIQQLTVRLPTLK